MKKRGLMLIPSIHQSIHPSISQIKSKIMTWKEGKWYRKEDRGLVGLDWIVGMVIWNGMAKKEPETEPQKPFSI